MAMMYTSDGWVEVKFPPFLDLDEICRKQDEEEEKSSQEKNNNQTDETNNKEVKNSESLG